MMKKLKTKSNSEMTPAELISKGCDVAQAIAMNVLLDKFGFDEDQIQYYWECNVKMSSEVKEGRILLKDIKRMLAEEYSIYMDEEMYRKYARNKKSQVLHEGKT